MPEDKNKNTFAHLLSEKINQSLATSLWNQLAVHPALVSGQMNPPSAVSVVPSLSSFALASEASTATKMRELEKEMDQLRSELQERTIKLNSEKANTQKAEKAAKELQDSIDKLKQKESLAFLLSRVDPAAHDKLLSSEEFRAQFFSPENCHAFVVAVDIRRSTELMLKARQPKMFAEFISGLCSNLEAAIKQLGGVFDKFTGDGVLAFFPEFYSGKDAGYRALATAQKCQDLFKEHYKAHRRSFTTILNDVGLGIGIDYGPVHLLNVAGGLTVVGSPVVYACRLSSAPAGHIYLNQPAFETIGEKHGNSCYTDEVELDIKHEGKVLCYDVRLTKADFSPAVPSWQLEGDKES